MTSLNADFQHPANMNNHYATIILCGGASRRMGKPKSDLSFGNETLLKRTIRIVQQVTPQIILSAGRSQKLPGLSDEIEIVRDHSDLPGPLGGLHAVMSTLQKHPRWKAVFVCSCDTPLISKPVLQFLKQKYESAPDSFSLIVAAKEQDRTHPFPGLYDVSLFKVVDSLWQSGNRRMIDLLEQGKVLEIPVEEFREVDPNLDFLINVNTLEQYQKALQRAKP